MTNEVSQFESRILVVRGQKVVLDRDLAELYGVDTKRLNEQVRRNARRFPSDFMFSLTNQEVVALKSQFATLGYAPGPRAAPKAFTEHGAIMAASVLNSTRAIQASVYVVRTFIKLRALAHANSEVRQKLDELERRVGGHDKSIAAILKALNQLLAPQDEPAKRSIGFAAWPDAVSPIRNSPDLSLRSHAPESETCPSGLSCQARGAGLLCLARTCRALSRTPLRLQGDRRRI